MDFNQTEDRSLISSTLRRFLSAECPLEARAQYAYVFPFHSPTVWDGLCELGIPGALIDKTYGGYGGKGFDIITVFEEIGRSLSPEPMLGYLLGTRLLAEAGYSKLDDVLSGRAKVAAAIFEPDCAESLEDLTTIASYNQGQWTVSGHKSVVYGAPSADMLVVAAVHSNGIGIFLVEEFESKSYCMIDGGGAGDIVFDKSIATCLNDNADVFLQEALDAGRLALCAEAVGIMDALIGQTTDYLKQRRQFGSPLSGFQALRHRVVDLSIEIEQARSITILAASQYATPGGRRTISMAKNLIGRTGKLVAEEVIQMHGGIAMSWEYPASHMAKRLIMIDHQLGNSLFHASQIRQFQSATEK